MIKSYNMQVHPMGGSLLTLLTVLLMSSFCIQHTFAQDTCQGLVAQLQDLDTQLVQSQIDLQKHNCGGGSAAGCIKRQNDIRKRIVNVQRLLDKNCAPGSAVSDPPYSVITVLYALPGNLSEGKYGNGSTTGSRSEVKQTKQAGLQVQLNFSEGVEFDAGYQYGVIDGHFLETKKEASKTITLTSQVDPIDHKKDMFYLWVNPELVANRPEVGAPVTVTLQVKPGQPMQIVNLTAEELLDPSKIPATKKPLVAGLKTADYNQILSSDPFLSGAPLDTNRFVKVDTLQLDGPDQPGDPISGNGLEVSNESTAGTIAGTTQKVTLTLLAGFKFLGIGAKAGISYEWDYENTTETSTGQIQKIEAVLRTSTVAHHDVVDVYLDSMFNSFAYVSTVANASASHAPDLSGTIKDHNGAPVLNALVEVLPPDGSKRRVFSNSRGVYRVFDLAKHGGEASVRVGDQQQRVVLIGSGLTTLDFANR